MFVLNAMRKTISILMDDGKLVSIKGGEMSTPMIATISCMNQVRTLGTPKEICMVLLMSSEQKMAIAAGIPMEYIKTSKEDAIKALIDPNVDYSSAQIVSEAHIVTKQYEDEIDRLNNLIGEKDVKISELEANVTELKSEIETLISNKEDDKFKDIKVKELESQVEEQKAKVSSLESEKAGLQSTLDSITTERNNLQTQLNSQSEKIKLAQAASTQVEQLTKEKQELEGKVDELKKGTAELIDKNEKMKATMKAVCDQFNIKFNSETGEWEQSPL
jgi:predicted RNase H-like nuclease (RuvC/YqgF family)